VRSRSAASQPCSSICMSSQARNTTCLPFVSLSPCPLSLIVPVTRTRAHTRVHFRHAPLLHRHCLHSCWMNRICGRGFSRHDDRTRSARVHAMHDNNTVHARTPLSKNGHVQQSRAHQHLTILSAPRALIASRHGRYSMPYITAASRNLVGMQRTPRQVTTIHAHHAVVFSCAYSDAPLPSLSTLNSPLAPLPPLSTLHWHWRP
jgi:hypothetical protein